MEGASAAPLKATPEALRLVGRVAGPLLALGLMVVPSGLHAQPGVGSRPAAAAAVTAWMAVWWFTEAFPMGWTSLLPLVLYPLLDVFGTGSYSASLSRAVQPFVDPYIFLFVGGMSLGAAIEYWGLHRRMALHILLWLGSAPRRLLLGMLVATAFVSMWLPNTTTAVMMMPIAMALLAQLEASEGRRLEHFGTALLLAVAYACTMGGLGTKIGSPTNSVFAGVAGRRLGVEMGFWSYMAVALPFVVMQVPLVWWWLWRHGQQDGLRPESRGELVRRQLEALGPLSRSERVVGGVFLGAVVLWVSSEPLRVLLAPGLKGVLGGLQVQGKHVEAVVALGAAGLLWALGKLPRQALRRVPWDTGLLVGGGFALAAGIENSGLSGWMTAGLAGLQALPGVAQYGVVALVSIVLSAVASNTATANVLLNVLPGSLPLLAVSTLGASCDFALPAGTPPNAIVFGSGRVQLPVMMRLGVVLNALSAGLVTLYGWLYLQWLLG